MSCLALPKEMKSILIKFSSESREEVMKKLPNGVLCENASFQSSPHAEEKMREACKHLLDVSLEDFGTALFEKEEDPDLLLHYERTLACVGTKQLKNQNHHPGSVSNDIQALTQENKAKVHTPRPVRADTVPSKEEL
ncbi:hypothetical protein GN956_G2917 [Arapaima gigas]